MAMTILNFFVGQYNYNPLVTQVCIGDSSCLSRHIQVAKKPHQPDEPIWTDCLDWFKREEFTGYDGEKRMLSKPRPTVVVIYEDGWVFRMGRLIEPSEKDWNEYADLCGCKSPFEAQTNYGDIPLSWDIQKVFVPWANMDKFLRNVVKYCW